MMKTLRINHMRHADAPSEGGLDRRIILIIGVVVAAMLWLVPTAQAQVPSILDTIRVVSVDNVSPGDTFNLDFYIRNVDSLGAFNFRCMFDQTSIEPLLDTNTGNQQVSVEFEEAERPTDPWEQIGGSTPSAGVMTFVAVDFDAAGLPGINYFGPGSGIAIRIHWRVLPTASNGVSTITFQNDPVFPASFNTFTDLTASIFKRPVLTGGTVTIGEDIDTTTTPENDPPTIPAVASPVSVNQGDLLTFNVSATDPEGDSLSLLAFNLPTGATFTPNNPVLGKALVTGTFRWTPTFSQSGSFVVSFRATDSAGLSSSVRNVTVNVVEVAVDLLFTTSADGLDPRGGVPGAPDVVVPVSMSATQPVYGVQFDFVYDPSVFIVTELQPTDRIPLFTIYEDIGANPGRLRVVAFSLTGAQVGAGTSPVIFNIIGDIVSDAPPDAYDIVFENSWESINPNPNVASIPLATQDGQIFVDNLGDANVDTRVDVGDVVAVVGYILGDFTFDTRQFRAGDVITNDTLDVFDLVEIINIIFGAPPSEQQAPAAAAKVSFVYLPDDGPYGSYVLTADAPVDIAGAQFEVVYDPKTTSLGLPTKLAGADGVDFQYRNRSDGRMVGLLTYDPRTDVMITPGERELLRIPLSRASAGIPDVRLREIKLSTPLAEHIEVAGFNGIPRSFHLQQNYPNPFNAATTIAFRIEGDGSGGPINARLDVFNVLGQMVRTLHDGPILPGTHTFTWDGTDDGDRPVASGLYFYRLVSGKLSEARKMVLLK